jgi:hypothetical protein
MRMNEISDFRVPTLTLNDLARPSSAASGSAQLKSS